MTIAALLTWIGTALGGFVMLGRWISQGGHRPGSGSRLSPALVFTHFALAAIGLVVWIAYLVTDTAGLAWTGFVLLLPVALLGFTMLAKWIPTVRAGGSTTPEARFPLLIVVAHGVLAATTLVLALLAALNA